MKRTFLLAALLACLALPLTAQSTPPPEVPLRAGLTVVLTVAGDPRGDYETVVSVTEATERDVALSASWQVDEAGRPRSFRANRRVRRSDLDGAPQVILGFHTDDAPQLPGTTALGPSVSVVRELRTNGRATLSIKNYARFEASTGTLSRIEAAPVPFPVLLNGRRVMLPAIHAAGRLRHPQVGERAWDLLILDHPAQPILLKVAYGAAGAGLPLTSPEWSRQVVRIDLPEAERLVEETLATECRVEAPGIYFEFNSATLSPQSEPALRSLAELLRRRADWRISIEGHTDNIGSDRYNQDLSTRRAEAVREALVRRFEVAPARLMTAGFGESRPRETNDTPEGRARNRRVELVRECPQGSR